MTEQERLAWKRQAERNAAIYEELERHTCDGSDTRITELMDIEDTAHGILVYLIGPKPEWTLTSLEQTRRLLPKIIAQVSELNDELG